MTFTLHVDADRCTGHGMCYSLAPDLLEDDPEGFVTLRGSHMPIAPEDLEEAERAVGACPEQAISLVESDD